MQLNDLASGTFNQLFGRLLRRALGAVLLAAFAIAAIFYANGAGTLALTERYGALNAYMIMAAIYAVFALIVFVVLWANRPRPVITDRPEGALASPRNMQIAMLIEAAALGYSMARKSGSRIP
ncbi:MAG: hypothetical protein PSV22_25695 [Pseudolabrys sp.]|nr:hypothetical protein [Pseudolabrys sp.]